MNEGRSIITYGVCGASNSRNEVRPIAENDELFQAVVECYGESESGWLKVKRLGEGKRLYEILPDRFHKKTAPKFLKCETVFVPRKSCDANVSEADGLIRPEINGRKVGLPIGKCAEANWGQHRIRTI